MLNRLPEKLNKFALYLSGINEVLKICLNEGSGVVDAFLDTETPAMFQGGIFQLPRKLGQQNVVLERKAREGSRTGSSILYRFLEKGSSLRINLPRILSSRLFLPKTSLYKEGRELTLSPLGMNYIPVATKLVLKP